MAWIRLDRLFRKDNPKSIGLVWANKGKSVEGNCKISILKKNWK